MFLLEACREAVSNRTNTVSQLMYITIGFLRGYLRRQMEVRHGQRDDVKSTFVKPVVSGTKSRNGIRDSKPSVAFVVSNKKMTESETN